LKVLLRTIPDVPLAGRWPAHWFPRSAPCGRGFGSFENTPALQRSSKTATRIDSGRRVPAAVRKAGGMMSTRVFGLILLVSTVVLGSVGMVAQTRMPGDTLQLWEYRTEITRDRAAGAGEARRNGATPEAMLNARGAEGWELVGVTWRDVRIENTIQTETMYAFKRPTRSVNR
jgi:hypothetical protein